ncbi:hypothetical protein [Allonocardiopsis opalescens]|nr:hypothetical protein [Allonocardiopsis opalescens]
MAAIDSLITTVLIPAAVAVCTTLLVEYFAKPWLEARKERILEAHRARREAAAVGRRIYFDLGRLEDPVPEDMPEPNRTTLVNEVKAKRESILADSRELERMLPRIGGVNALTLLIAARVIGTVQGTALSDASDAKVAEVRGAVGPLFDLLELGWWRPGWWRAYFRVCEALGIEPRLGARLVEFQQASKPPKR